MDYCEESLQEIDITSFLQTLCGHVRDFQESGEGHSEEGGNSRRPPTFDIGDAEEDGTAVSSSR